jgi:2-iminobutanoate/2-iminopropanoate deaminase
MKAVQTDKAPAPVGPYNQAIIHNQMVFTAGQIAIDPVTSELHADTPVEEQTKLVLKNLQAVLEAAGSDLAKVIKTTVFLQNMSDFNAMNEVYSSFFKAPFPARSAIEAAKLPKGVKVEIECIAYL